MHISLTAQQEEWVKSLIDSGHYTSTSEVVRHAIRLLQDEADARKAKLGILREALQKGIDEINTGSLTTNSVSELITTAKRRRA